MRATRRVRVTRARVRLLGLGRTPRPLAAFAVLLTIAALVVRQPASPAHASQPRWVLQASNTTANLRDVSCSSASECVAVGAHGAVVRTVNGGGSWERVSVPYAAAHPAVAFTSVRCPAAGVCSVLAPPNVVLRTNNGGQSWQEHRLALPASLAGLTRLACPTRSVCLAIASPNGLDNTPFDNPAAVFKTGDGGKSWHRLSIPPSVPCPDGDCYHSIARIDYDLQWISCQSAANCFAGGDTFLNAISHEGGYVSAVIRTGDGGKTWKLIHDSFDPNIGTCPTPNTCVGVWYEPRTPSVGPYLYRTTDGGLTWWSTWSRVTPIQPALTAVGCSGQTFCELAGPHGALAMLITTKLYVQVSPTHRHLRAVTCPRVSACYAVGADGTIVARK